MPRIHVLGASGSGTTTLGTAVAERLGVPHEESDSFFWMPTDPQFTTPRLADERLVLLQQRLPVTRNWVFSGSAIKWATSLEAFYDLIVFLRLDPTERMQRLRQREVARYGKRIEPGGDMTVTNTKFLEWAASYDTGGPEGRSLVAHETWLVAQKVPVLRLDSSKPVEELVLEVLSKLTCHDGIARRDAQINPSSGGVGLNLARAGCG